MNRNILKSASNAVELSGYHLFQILQLFVKNSSRKERMYQTSSWMYRVLEYLKEFGSHHMNKVLKMIPIKIVSVKADMEKDAKLRELQEEIERLKARPNYETIHVKETSFHVDIELDENDEVSKLSIQFHDAAPTPPPTPPPSPPMLDQIEHEQSLVLSPIAYNKPKENFAEIFAESGNKLFNTPAKVSGRGLMVSEIVQCARELRKVERSPGGTPVRIQRGDDSLLNSSNAHDIIANALRMKFKNVQISPDRVIKGTVVWDDDKENVVNY